MEISKKTLLKEKRREFTTDISKKFKNRSQW